MEHSSRHFVSVIVPVYNDVERLKHCLEALDNQTYPPSDYEVIVVDNGSDSAEKIDSVVTLFRQAFYLYESTPGSYAARNRGISVAKGEIIAFTDADCIPALDWLEQGVTHLQNAPNCGLVAGKIELFFKNTQKITPVELYESITAFPQKELLEKHRYGAGANLLTWKQVIEKVGVFDATLKSSGDVEWCRRIFDSGYQQIYSEETCVQHPARTSWLELYKRTIRLVGGIYDLQHKKNSRNLPQDFVFISLLLKNLIPPLNFVVNTFLDKRLKNVQQKVQVSVVMFVVRYVSALEIIKLRFGGVSARE
ncbi:glycosyltransferase [Limnoraphis robusta]|uniref:Glycosyl transferase family 2 n=1 Tax=Limnoraphis robusta CS-951 TaxID=1637645 RepID=A0A0F5YE99_9CYAN|nr:glycosyltransferase family 2 protein [Limnoraphis robusta]KKD36535.1 glycosyl transferase family 2 [Limnoraphis robusta CS-951]